MPTYYYKFDITPNQEWNSSSTVSNDGWDVSDFSGGPRGDAQVADYTDFQGFTADDFDQFFEVFGITSGMSFALIGWAVNAWGTSSYYRPGYGGNYAFYMAISIGTKHGSGWHINRPISASPLKEMHIGSWHSHNRPVLVYFPDYEPNGGHNSLYINGTTEVIWNSVTTAFESEDGTKTLSHNGDTWEISGEVSALSGSSSTASYDGNDVGDHVDPASEDLVWSGGETVGTEEVIAPSPPSAAGDPHIRPMFGKPYTI